MNRCAKKLPPMFGNKAKENGRTANGAPAAAGNHGLNSLVTGTVVDGTVRSTSDFRVDGKITGTLHCDAKVIIGPGGVVEGEIFCENAMVEGTFTGTIKVKELLNIRENATVQGEIRYSKLIVQPGAVLVGDVRLNGSPEGQTTGKSAAKKVSANGTSSARTKETVS